MLAVVLDQPLELGIDVNDIVLLVADLPGSAS